MLKIYLLISIITTISFAQKMTLDVRDYFTKRAITLDSINIKNEIIGIDTTITNPINIDLTNLLIANSVPKEQFYNISFNNNQLEVISNENIENIQLVDLLGREVINAKVNNTSFRANIENRNNSLLYFISIKTKSGYYHSKMINSTYNNLQTAYILPNSTNWEFTLYKLGYISEKVELPNLPLTLKFELKRIPIIGKFKFTMYNLVYSHWRLDHEPWNDDESSYSGTGAISFDFNLDLFSIEKNVVDLNNVYIEECYYTYNWYKNFDYLSYIKPVKSVSSGAMMSDLIDNTFWYYIIVNNSLKLVDIFIGIFDGTDEDGEITFDKVCMGIKLMDFNLNDLYNESTNIINYELSDSINQSISFSLTDKTNLGPSTYETDNIQMTDSTKTTGTITFELKK